jgi:5-methylcytosine-specific restriction endonuclease McrA
MAMKFPKVKRVKNKKLLKEIRNRPCAACLQTVFQTTGHHLKSKGAGGDDTEENLISLCFFCHHLVHAIGTTAFIEEYPHLEKILTS